MTAQDKIDVLKKNGWDQYYSKTHWVHEDICSFFEKADRYYYGRDYTNYQMTVDEAYELYLKCQKN